MAITKQFQAHTELKAEDLNELISQTNDYIVQEGNKKPDKVDITDYETSGAILPLSSYYTHGGKPTYSRIGTYDSTDFLAIIVATWGNSNPNTLIYLYTKDNQNLYRFNSTFYSNDDDLTNMEQYVVAMVAGTPVSYTRNGLMTSADKMTFDEMVTEVFPLTVGVVSSNAGTRETGSSITPSIVLSVTRKGVNIDITSDMVSVSPNDGSLNAATKTYTGAAISSGSKTYQIAVTQGGQTRSIPNQVFDFMNYRYYGVINSSTEPTKAQVKTLCENGTLTKQLSRSTKMGATDLAANKCFVFVVPNTSVNLVVKNAKSGNPISGCTVDTVTVNRVNGTAEVSCKYVIVPAGSAAWTFEITN